MQERLYHLEQWASIESSPPPPFVPPCDPLVLYDEACVAYADEAASHPHGKNKATEEDEDYIEDYDDVDDDGDDGDHDDDEDYNDEYLFPSHGLPLLALVDKGGVLGFDYHVIR